MHHGIPRPLAAGFLIAGPTSFICNECVELCVGLINEGCIAGFIADGMVPLPLTALDPEGTERQITAAELLERALGMSLEGAPLAGLSGRALLDRLLIEFWIERYAPQLSARVAELERRAGELNEQLDDLRARHERDTAPLHKEAADVAARLEAFRQRIAKCSAGIDR